MTKLAWVLLAEGLIGGFFLWQTYESPAGWAIGPGVFIGLFVVLGLTLGIARAFSKKGSISGGQMLIVVLGFITALLGYLSWSQGYFS